jgi:excinuclease ABC subunit B
LDNRPLKFEEFETLLGQIIYVSATPSDYELNQSQGIVVEQLIRPTGLLDPQIEVKPSLNQIDDLLNEIELRTVKHERILVTTLTKRMAEELSKYMLRLGISCKYIHSEVETLDRIEILRDLRMGSIDVLIGVNLLREGLDLPEVSLVAILDADKEGFLRSEKSLTQTAGRAARNINSKVIFYADKMTKSMQQTIDETNRKRAIQIAYNIKYNITPTQIIKNIEPSGLSGTIEYKTDPKAYVEKEVINTAADPLVKYMNDDQLKKQYDLSRRAMEKAAKELDFIEAARLRDEMLGYKELIDNRKKSK